MSVSDEINANFSSATDVRLLHSAYVSDFHLRTTTARCLAQHKTKLTLLPQIEYLDKTLVNYANVMGLQADAGINGTQLQTTTGNRQRDVELMFTLHFNRQPVQSARHDLLCFLLGLRIPTCIRHADASDCKVSWNDGYSGKATQ
jgi:hypothetical protein